MGVWIEIMCRMTQKLSVTVTPLVGVWIEICVNSIFSTEAIVTPLVGVWIEIQKTPEVPDYSDGHSPCGSVD